MSAQLPSLDKDGAVVFTTPGDFEASWASSLCRGALIVRPERALQPLEQLDVRIVVPGLVDPLALRVELVSLQPERALLRLVDPIPPKPELHSPRTEPDPPEPEPLPLEALTPVPPPPEALPLPPEPLPLDALTPVPPPPEALPLPPEPLPLDALTPVPPPPDALPPEPLPLDALTPVPPPPDALPAEPLPLDALTPVPPPPEVLPPEPLPLEALTPVPPPPEAPTLEAPTLEAPSPEEPSPDVPSLEEPPPELPPEALTPVPMSTDALTAVAPPATVEPPPAVVAAPATFGWAPLAPFAPPPLDDDDVMPAPGDAVPLARTYTPVMMAAPFAPPPVGPPAATTTAAAPEAAPEEAAPVGAPPVEAPPVEAPPVEAPPVEAPPVEAAPVEAAPVEAPSVEAPPVEAAPVEAAPVEAAPVEAAPVDAAPVEAAAVEVAEAVPVEVPPVEPVPAEASSGAGAAAAPVMMPPVLIGDALRFGTLEDFERAKEHLEGVGAVLAVADGVLPLGAIDVRIIVADREGRSRAKVTIAAAAPGTAVVQAVERGGFKPLLAEHATAPPPSPEPEPTRTTSQATPAVLGSGGNTGAQENSGIHRAHALPRQGTLVNPTTPAQILALPLTRPPAEADIASPSVPFLLRWLRTTRGVLRLEVTAENHPVFTVVFVDGREVRSPASLTSLGKSLALPHMSYFITDLGRPPQMTTTGRTQHLIGEVVRALCGHCEVEDLAREFPNREGRCPRAVPDVVSSLGLPAQHQRFVKSDVDGTQFVDEIARAAVGGRTIWETLYLLEIYNGLSWDEPPEGKSAAHRPSAAAVVERQRSGRTGSFAPPNLDEIWAPFEGKDHFQVLGLHWSSSPNEVGPAYQKLRSEYGPGGMKRTSNAQTADKIMKRLEEAHRVLSDARARQAYRREKYNLVWPHQAALLVQKAKLSVYRKDWHEAEDILLAAEDMCSTEEARAMLTAVRKKLSGGQS